MSDLHIASRNGSIPDMKKLLDCGDDTLKVKMVNALDKHKRNPLHLAAFFGHADAVEMLLEAKANVHDSAMDGFTALHFAAQNGHASTCRILLSHRTTVDRCLPRTLRTPLYLSLLKGHTDAAHILIRKGADLSHRASDGRCPLDLVTQPADKEELEALAKHVYDLGPRGKRRRDETPLDEEEDSEESDDDSEEEEGGGDDELSESNAKP